MRKTITIIFIMILFVALGYFATKYFSLRRAGNGAGEAVATISNEQMNGGKILGESESGPVLNSFASENFHAPQISFGGDAITYPAGQQAEAPEIQNLRSELATAKTDQSVKFRLSWKTNKLCKSSIEYTREGQTEGKTISDDGYGFVHSVEIAPLNYATTYSYKVSARDKWGNEATSDKLAFYTGAPNVSILDLLGGAFKNMFGWAGRQ